MAFLTEVPGVNNKSCNKKTKHCLYLGNPKDSERQWEEKISVIVPTFHEARNLPEFFATLLKILDSLCMPYEIIVADDHSRDGTAAYIHQLSIVDPSIKLLDKKGALGKGQSLLEAIPKTKGNIIAIVPANLRYPLEVLTLMFEQVREGKDIVIARRASYISFLRGVRSRLFRLFCSIFLRLPYDVQSGMKVFRKKILVNMPLNSAWGFDLQLVTYAKRYHLSIAELPIVHKKRVHEGGKLFSIIETVKAVAGAIVYCIDIFFRSLFPFLYPPEAFEYYAAGYNNVIDYLYLAPSQSAKLGLTKEIVSLFYVVSLLIAGTIWALSSVFEVYAIQIILGVISSLYLFLVFLKIYLIVVSSKHPGASISVSLEEPIPVDQLPVISAMIPLYKEKEIIPQIVDRMKAMEYPTQKFDVCFILEENDPETKQALIAYGLPSNFRILSVPDALPKTKPKALNYALPRTKGEILVIYDAEVLPERDQLMKAVLMFRRHPENHYLHSKMDHYNADFNWLTRQFNAEFCFFYNFYFPGMIFLQLPVPISGHSTYFKRYVLEHMQGWDAYNVAEDCDIGIRMYREGFGSGMVLGSYTWEQATTTINTWMHQRTRWIQGFIQTTMTQLRYPLLLKQELGGWKNFLLFLVFVPGHVFINVLNIVLWFVFLVWVICKPALIASWFPMVSLYMANISFFIGNYLFILYAMIGVYNRRQFLGVPWAIAQPLYWILLAVATSRAVMHFIVHPYFWDKTAHFISENGHK